MRIKTTENGLSHQSVQEENGNKRLKKGWNVSRRPFPRARNNAFLFCSHCREYRNLLAGIEVYFKWYVKRGVDEPGARAGLWSVILLRDDYALSTRRKRDVWSEYFELVCFSVLVGLLYVEYFFHLVFALDIGFLPVLFRLLTVEHHVEGACVLWFLKDKPHVPVDNLARLVCVLVQ